MIILKKLLFIATVFLTINAFSQYNLSNSYFELPIVPYQNHSSKYAFKNFKGEALSEKEIDFIDDGELKEFGLIFIIKDNLYGLFDTTGKQLTKIEYEFSIDIYYQVVRPYPGSLLKVFKEGKWGLINMEGKEILPCQYSSISEPFNGYYQSRRDKIGIIDSLGNIVLDFVHDSIEYHWFYRNDDTYFQGFSILKDNKWGVMDLNYKIVFPLEYDLPIKAERFNEGIVNAKNGLFGLFDMNQEILIDFQFDTLYSSFAHGIYNKSINARRFVFSKSGKLGVIDKEGEEILPPQYDKITQIGKLKSIYSCIQNGLTGVYDDNGKSIVPQLYTEISAFNDSVFKVKESNKWGIYSAQEQRLISEMKYDSLLYIYKCGIIEYKLNGKYGLLNSLGEEIVLDKAWQYEDFEVTNKGIKTYYLIFENNKGSWKKENFGLIDGKGQIVVPPIYKDIWNEGYGFVAAVAQNDKLGLIEAATGKIVHAFTLTSEEYEFFNSRNKLRYEMDYTNATFKLDTVYYKNGQIKEIVSTKLGILNGMTHEYDEFGQYLQSIQYQHGNAIVASNLTPPKIVFEPTIKNISDFIISSNENVLLAIPKNKKEGLFQYDIRSKKFIQNIYPDSDIFYEANRHNSMIIDSMLYLFPLKYSNYYEVLNLKSGKSQSFKIKDKIPAIQFLEKGDYNLYNLPLTQSGWMSTLVIYTKEYYPKTKMYLSVFSKNLISGDSLSFNDVNITKDENLMTLFDDGYGVQFFPEHNLLVQMDWENECWNLYLLKNKSFKKLESILFYEQIDSNSSINRAFKVLGSEAILFEDASFKQDYQYHTVSLPKFKKTEIGITSSQAASLNFWTYFRSNTAHSKVFITTDNFIGLYDKVKNEIQFHTYLSDFPSENHINYLFRENKLIGFTENGAFSLREVEDSVVSYSSNFQTSISFAKYADKQLFLDGFYVDLAKGVFSKKETSIDSSKLYKNLISDVLIQSETNLSLFDSTYYKSLENAKMIAENVESNGNRMISFYNHNESNYLERHVFLRVFNDNDFLLYTPDHYYMGSKSIGKVIYFEQSLKFFPFEQFDLKYNRPDIILSRLGYADSSLISAYHAAYKKRLKKMDFTEEMLRDNFNIPTINIKNFHNMPTLTDSASIEIELNLLDELYPLDRINVWVNDVAVYGSNGISLREKYLQIMDTTIRVQLAQGNNKIQVSVLNQAGAESYKETFTVNCKAGKEKPNLYVVAIGVSTFEQSQYNLKFAAKDAEDIAKVYANNKNYGKVVTKTLTNQEVTKENIEQLREFLKAADRNDEVIVFFAGHGVLDAQLDYYLASYDMDFSNPSARGIAYEQLENLLDGIAPLKKTLLIDACHSGEIDKDEVAINTNTGVETGDVKFRNVGNSITQKDSHLGLQNTSELTKSLFADLRKGTGATVISSAGGMEFAMESSQWQNGLFTYCYINGLQSKAADLNKDGVIMLSELQQYVATQVTQLSNGKQQPTSRIENNVLDWRVW